MKPYEGTKPYIFVSYAHKDSEQVLPIFEALNQAGYRIWYDRGIPWSTEWADIIADHVEACTVCLAFHSEASKTSRNCREELYYALGEGKLVFSVFLDDVKLSKGLKLRLSPYQTVKLSQFDSPEAFVERLSRETVFLPCKTPGWNKSGQIQWRVDEDNILTVLKNEDIPDALGIIPDYQADYVKGGSSAPWMLYRDRIVSVVVRDDIGAIGDFAFYGCDNLANVAIPDSVTSIGKSAFANCRHLTELFIPDSVTKIGMYAFEQCAGLTIISIPDSIASIGGHAFSGCLSLTDCVLPDSVSCVDLGTFVNCKNLAHITIPDSVTSIKEGAFMGCERLSLVEVPKNAEIDFHAFDAHTHVIRRNEKV